MVTPAGKRDALTHLRTNFMVSERRACLMLNVERSLIRYQSVRPNDAVLRSRLRELSHLRKRFGYRRLHILLARGATHCGAFKGQRTLVT